MPGKIFIPADVPYITPKHGERRALSHEQTRRNYADSLLPHEEGRPRENFASLRFGHLDGVDVAVAVHVRPEDNPFGIGREGGIWFETVIVAGEIDQLLSLKFPTFRASLDTFSVSKLAGDRPKEVNPLAILRWLQPAALGQRRVVCDAVRAATVTREQFAIPRNRVVHRPLAAGDGISHAFSRVHAHARKPELFGPRGSADHTRPISHPC
jgi:hypothetical protein